MALLLTGTIALDPGASTVLGAAKVGTAGATNGAAGRVTAAGGAVYKGAVTDGTTAFVHAIGRAA